MSQNLWQVANFDDLLYFLRNGTKKFIVLSLVLVMTEDKYKHMIKKAIKQKSTQYPNVTFLYYAVRESDIGRISILDKDKSRYPKMCHIYDIKELLLEIASIDNPEIIEDSFKKLDGYYKNHQNNDNSNSDISEEDDEKSIPKVNNNTQNNINNTNNNGFVQEKSYTNPLTEKKKFLEKLTLLKSKADDYTIEFLKECQQRKKEEGKKKEKK